MMTRKHYKMIARCMKELRSDLKSGTMDKAIAFDRAISSICADLRSDNPNFNSAKFRDAIYD